MAWRNFYSPFHPRNVGQTRMKRQHVASWTKKIVGTVIHRHFWPHQNKTIIHEANKSNSYWGKQKRHTLNIQNMHIIWFKNNNVATARKSFEESILIILWSKQTLSSEKNYVSQSQWLTNTAINMIFARKTFHWKKKKLKITQQTVQDDEWTAAHLSIKFFLLFWISYFKWSRQFRQHIAEARNTNVIGFLSMLCIAIVMVCSRTLTHSSFQQNQLPYDWFWRHFDFSEF